jgi:hypothetical protein
MNDWRVSRNPSGICIPIDYSADVDDVLIAVSWSLLMMGGLRVRSKFQVQSTRSGQSRPSWVIDWRNAAAAFRRYDAKKPRTLQYRTQTELDEFGIRIGNAWDRSIVTVKHGLVVSTERIPCSHPVEHTHLQHDNAHGAESFHKLVPRGMQVTRFYVQDDFVWAGRGASHARQCWHIQSGTEPTDIVVYLSNFLSMGHRGMLIRTYPFIDRDKKSSYGSDGLWLLRPVGNDEYILLACLSWIPVDDHQFYNQWEWRGEGDASLRAGEHAQYRRMAVDPLPGIAWTSEYSFNNEEDWRQKYREFVIIMDSSGAVIIICEKHIVSAPLGILSWVWRIYIIRKSSPLIMWRIRSLHRQQISRHIVTVQVVESSSIIEEMIDIRA